MKKVLSLVLSAALLISFSLVCNASDFDLGSFLSDDAELSGSPNFNPDASPEFSSVENVSLTFYITALGKADIFFSVSAAPEAGTFVIKSYIEKWTAGIFWRKVSVSAGNNEWTESTSERFYMNSHTVNVLSDGEYRATVKIICPNGDIVTKTASFYYNRGVLQGDVNFDSKITASDARSVLRYSARLQSFTSRQKERADLNFDGKITSYDARIVLRISAGLI